MLFFRRATRNSLRSILSPKFKRRKPIVRLQIFRKPPNQSPPRNKRKKTTRTKRTIQMRTLPKRIHRKLRIYRSQRNPQRNRTSGMQPKRTKHFRKHNRPRRNGHRRQIFEMRRLRKTI